MDDCKIILEFCCFSKAAHVLGELQEWQDWKEQGKKPKVEGDRRGQHAKAYHQLAREYHAQFPLIPYRECYKIVSKK